MKLKFSTKIASVLFMLAVALLFAEPYQSDEFALTGLALPAGMGGIRSVGEWDGLSALANPASINQNDAISIAVTGGTQWSGLVDIAQIGIALPGGNIGYAAAISFNGGDGIPITQLQYPDEPLSDDNRPIITAYKSHHTISGDIAAAKRWHKLAIGVSAKFVHKKIPDISAVGFSASAGVLYELSSKIQIGALAHDISTYQLFWNDNTHETGMPSLSIGASYRTALFSKLTLGFSAEGNYGIDEKLGFLRAGVCATYAGIVSFALGTEDGAFRTGAEVNISRYSIGASGGYHSSLGETYNVSLKYRFSQ